MLLSPSSSEDVLASFEKLLESQPEPRLFDDILSEVRQNLLDFPNALLGEVGLDRAFRIAYDYDATPRILTSFTVPFEHQLKIFEAQLELAVELKRNMSWHSVKAPDATLQQLERMANKFGDKFWDVSVDIHSCGFSAQMWKDIEVRCWSRLAQSSADQPSHPHTRRKNIAMFSSHSPPP